MPPPTDTVRAPPPAEATPRRSRWRRVAGMACGAAAFGYLFARQVSWAELMATLQAVDLRLGLPILLLQTGFLVLGALALWLLVAGAWPVGWWRFLTAYWRCVLVGFWTPGAVGEFSLAWFLRGDGVPARQSLALMTVDKLVTGLAFAVLAVPILAPLGLGSDAFGPVAALAVAGLAGAAVLRVALRPRPRAAAGDGYVAALGDLVWRSPARLAGNFGVTLVRVLVAAAVFTACVESFAAGTAADVGFGRIVTVTAAARLCALVLPSPSGLGVYEVALVELFGAGGPSAAVIVAAVFLSRGVAFAVVGLGFFLPDRRPAPSTGAPP